MIPLKGNGGSNIGCAGELEIENLPITEVEIRQKDLLPVFGQLHTAYPEWSDRYHLFLFFSLYILFCSCFIDIQFCHS